MAADEDAIRRLLQTYDSELRLVPQYSDTWGCRYWSVYRYVGSETPAVHVCTWMTDGGEPLPLSSRLLEKVKELDRNTRSAYLDEVVRNELARQERDEQIRRDNEAMLDVIPKHGRPVLPRSRSLRMARDKRRAKGEKC